MERSRQSRPKPPFQPIRDPTLERAIEKVLEQIRAGRVAYYTFSVTYLDGARWDCKTKRLDGGRNGTE